MERETEGKEREIQTRLGIQTAKLYSLRELTKLLGIERITLIQWIKKGILPARRIGKKYYISGAQLVKWIAEMEIYNEAEEYVQNPRAEIEEKVEKELEAKRRKYENAEE